MVMVNQKIGIGEILSDKILSKFPKDIKKMKVTTIFKDAEGEWMDDTHYKLSADNGLSELIIGSTIFNGDYIIRSYDEDGNFEDNIYQFDGLRLGNQIGKMKK